MQLITALPILQHKSLLVHLAQSILCAPVRLMENVEQPSHLHTNMDVII